MMTDVFEEIINKIKQNSRITFAESFEYAKIISKELNTDNSDYARRVIINILDNWDKLDDSTKDIWVDLIEAAGFYPYIQKGELILNGTASKIRTEYHKSDLLVGKYYHEEQKILKDLLYSDKNVIVSAPTSFGKSLLIEELVASKKYKNLVIIQPTLALLDETRKKLLKYRDDYKIIIKTTQRPSEDKGNIFLLTAERVMEYDSLPKIDFLVLDEFYKLSSKRDDERSDVLNNAFYKLLNRYGCRFYLLGPNIDGISDGFAEKYNAIFYRTNYTLVDSTVIDVYKKHSSDFGVRGKKYLFKEGKLFELLYSKYDQLNEQTIIYCSSPDRVRTISQKFCNYLKSKKIGFLNEDLALVEWIKADISKDWGVIDCLKMGIGIHDGALPKHITSSIIDYFNNGKLKYLFCTTTIIEGVNTTAKNVIFFDSTKGSRKKIDYFDYCNIKGRAGRLMVHFTGTIYDFNPPISKELVIIDIPFFEQNPIADEVLIQLDESNIKYRDSKQYKKLSSLLPEERQLFKKNGISVWGQKKILDYLDENIDTVYPLINWCNFPKSNQLSFLIELCWDNFLKDDEAVLPLTKKGLTYFIFNYALKRSLQPFIKSTYRYNLKRKYHNSIQESLDDSICWVFKIQRHWIHYKIPKWIGVFNEIQKYVCNKHDLTPGDYSFYATQMENDFVQENLSIFLEYGIPVSAILKIEKYISPKLTEDQIFNLLKNIDFLKKCGLMPYEIKKIQEIL